MDQLITLGGIDDEVVGIIALGVGGIIATLAVIGTTIKNIVRTKARETTKREMAAYVAEGSMSPDDAERILKADPKDA